ncbi:PCNA-interacting partner isoform X2 [Polyodon spathula]|uniref:PCNA-interacting partner isoform X2 n=1 Tax=Polyodon spathula TaxID=7913 RepID=UPI001B7DDDFA|nr:PCNA-interacting partner isoform X2 [Polyodon spathula]
MMTSLQSNLQTMVKVFRRECHRVLESHRTTICGADEMLMVLQLSMAEINKEENGEFTVLLSNLLVTWKHLINDKLHLLHETLVAPENYSAIRKMYNSFLKSSNMVDLIDVYGMYDTLKTERDCEELLTPLPTVVKRLICAYLKLLVNSKNDLALAHVLNVPDRGLGRDAFTDLKHAARSTQTSLFLAATSFIRAIQLGGKGYAPSETDPLRKHLKGLSDFVHFTDNLEELLGELPDPSFAGSRIMSTIKARFLKGRSSEDPLCAAAEETVQELRLRIKNIIHSQKEAINASTIGISPARPKFYAINHSTAYGGRETVKVILHLLDEEATSPPSRNKADLLYGDEGEMAEAGAACVLTLFRSPEPSTGSSPKSLRYRVLEHEGKTTPKAKGNPIRSQFACTYRDDPLVNKNLLQFPSLSQVPTCVHPAPKRTLVPVICFDDEPSTDTTSIAANATENEALITKGKRPVFGSTSGNIQQKGNSRKKGSGSANGQPGNKSCKRKQVCVNSENGNCSHENEPPKKRVAGGPKVSDKPHNKLDCKTGAPGKGSKAVAKKKLIAGQGKLTNFFRL